MHRLPKQVVEALFLQGFTALWMWHLGTWVVWAVLREWLDLMILEGFPNLNKSVVL